MTINEMAKTLYLAAEYWRESKGTDEKIKELGRDVGHRLVKHEANQDYRAHMFRDYLEDPRVLLNPDISTFLLDPLLGINSLFVSMYEYAEEDPTAIYSNYAWLDILFGNEALPGSVYDFGAGIGRVGLYLRASQKFEDYMGTEVDEYRAFCARKKNLDVINTDKISCVSREDSVYFFNSFDPTGYGAFIQKMIEAPPFQILCAYDQYGKIKTHFNLYKEIEVPVELEGVASTHKLQIFRGLK